MNELHSEVFERTIRSFELKGVIYNNCDVDPLKLKDAATKTWHVNHACAEIVLVRASDFYWTFAGDAVRLAKAIEFCLVSRENLAMCGFPFHSLDRYQRAAQAQGIEFKLVELIQSKQSPFEDFEGFGQHE